MPRISHATDGGLVKPILAGFFGAMAPNLLQATAQVATGDGRSLLVGHVMFWFGAVIVAGLGAALVYFYDERSPKKALTLGAAAPALLLGLANGLPTKALDTISPPALNAAVQADSAVARGVSTHVFGASRASLTTATSQPRYVVIRGSGLRSASRLTLIAVQGHAGSRKSFSFQQSGTVLHVPDGTTQLYVIADGAESNHVSIEGIKEDSITVSVTVRVPAVRGFARAFGIRNAGSLHVALALVNTVNGVPPVHPAGQGGSMQKTHAI